MTSAVPCSCFHPRRGCRGTAVVEFAVATPLLLLLLLATAELGRAFLQYTILSYAVREAARFASENSIDGQTGLVVVSTQTATSTRNLAVYGNVGGTGSPRLPSFATGQVAVQASGGTNVTVAATYPYVPMVGASLPAFGLGDPISLTINLQIVTTMRAIS